MSSAASVELSGRFSVAAPVGTVFELFSPLGEKRWVPSFNPDLLYPPGETWAPGLIFRTREQRGAVVWVVTALDRTRHETEYTRVEPEHYVVRTRIACTPRGGETEVNVTYIYVALSSGGESEMREMTQAAFDQKVKRWQGWITAGLTRA